MDTVKVFRLLGASLIILGAELHVFGQPPGTPSPIDLLRQSQLIETQLLPDERCFFLFRVASVAAHIDQPLASSAADEMLDLTSRLDNTPNRQVLRKNAIVAKSMVDPDRAFKLLRQLDAFTSNDIPEDLRSSAAETVFSNYLRLHGKSALLDIEPLARQIGDTGLYPFRAMASVLLELQPEDKAASIKICDEALQYYRERSPASYANNFYADFVEKVWAIMSMRTQKESIYALLSRLLDSVPSPEDQALYRVWLDKDSRPIKFTNVFDVLLYQLIPKITRVGLTPLLLTRRPSWSNFLDQSIDGQSVPEVIFIAKLGLPKETLQVFEEKGLESHWTVEIHRRSATDRQEAIREIVHIPEPSVRADLLFEIASQLLRYKERSNYYKLIQKGQRELGEAEDNESKLRALARLAETTFAANDLAATSKTLDEGYDLGEELFEQFIQTHPAAPHYDSSIVFALDRLGRIGLRCERNRTLARIENTTDPILRAYLLIGAAQSLTLRRS